MIYYFQFYRDRVKTDVSRMSCPDVNVFYLMIVFGMTRSLWLSLLLKMPVFSCADSNLLYDEKFDIIIVRKFVHIY